MDVPEGLDISLEDVNKSTEVDESKKNWFDQSYWKNKDEPKEKRAINVDGEEIGIVNFNDQIRCEEFEERMRSILEDFVKRFPEAKGKLKWILIRDFQTKPLHDDFPSNGLTLKSSPEGTMVLEPRVFEDISHRIEGVPNLDGTLIHEMGHQVEEVFCPDWVKFWPMAVDHPENWIFDKTGKTFPTHRVTGQKATTPEGRFLANQQAVVTEYAKISMNEDICESLVAYVYKPELLKQKSLDRFQTIELHNQMDQSE